MTERTESTGRTGRPTVTETGNGAAKGGARTVEAGPERSPAEDYSDVFTPASERAKRVEQAEPGRVGPSQAGPGQAGPGQAGPGQNRGAEYDGQRTTAIVADQVTVAQRRPPSGPGAVIGPPSGPSAVVGLPGGSGAVVGPPGGSGAVVGPPGGPGGVVGPPSGSGGVVGPPGGPGGVVGPPSGPGVAVGGPAVASHHPGGPGGPGGYPGSLGVPGGAVPGAGPAAVAHGGPVGPPLSGYGHGGPGGGLGGPAGAGRPGGQPFPPVTAQQPPRPSQPLGARYPRYPRKASLQIRRFDPWSVLKLSLVLSVAMFLMWLVAVGVLYGVLDGMGVWDKLNGAYSDLASVNESGGGGESLISAGRVFGVSAVVGVVNIVLLTAFATVAAFVYNVSADLAGGIEVTLSEHD